jgi:hypothetical protein
VANWKSLTHLEVSCLASLKEGARDRNSWRAWLLTTHTLTLVVDGIVALLSKFVVGQVQAVGGGSSVSGAMSYRIAPRPPPVGRWPPQSRPEPVRIPSVLHTRSGGVID